MSALLFIFNALQYLLIAAFLLRVLLPLARANMRNPFSQAVLRFTNPIVIPLRRVLRPIGRIDTASFVALLLVQLATTLIVLLIVRHGIPSPSAILLHIFMALLYSLVQLYFYALLLYAVLSWIAPDAYSPGNELLTSLCSPLLRPVRRWIPPIGGLDLSALFVLIGLGALLALLQNEFRYYFLY